MKVYVDLTGERDCVGLLVHEAEVVLCGTTVHAEPVRYQTSESARRFREMGLHFWFGQPPEPPFYTIPLTTVLAHDGDGGYFLLTEDALYYDQNGACFWVCDSLRDFPEDWRARLKPCDEIRVYPSRAAVEHHIYSLTELMEELQ